MLLAQKGAKVAINDLDREKADEVVRQIRQLQGQAAAFPGNVLDDNFPRLLVNSVLQKWGKINCLINNAGMPLIAGICEKFGSDLLEGFCHDSAIHKMDDDKFDIIMKIHNYVPFRIARALSEHWMDPANKAMPKTIVNVSSTSGLHGSMGQINYATAKAGVLGLTKTIAAEWGRSVQPMMSLAIRDTDFPSFSDIMFGPTQWLMAGSIHALRARRTSRRR